MEDRSRVSIRWNGIKEPYLWGIVFIAAGIRFYNSFHFLLSDEAFNLISIEILSQERDFHPYFFKHPPLYHILSALFYYLIGPYPQVPSYISIFFSVISLFPFYLITEGLTGKRTALWAALFLAVMPANVYYSAWIKQDAMLLFFFLWGVYFYLNKRLFVAGLLIGIALLVKEFALLFLPISFLISAINRKERKWLEVLREWLVPVIVASVISSWWYFSFGQLFYLIAGEALTGAYIIEYHWHYPWWFFLKNLPYDLSYPLFALFFLGAAAIIKEMYKKEASPGYYIILAWLAAIYIPISFLYMKTPWFMYLATPPLAVVTSKGMELITQMFKSEFYKITMKIAVLSCIVLLLPTYSQTEYNLTITGYKARQSSLEVIEGIQGGSWNEMAMRKDYWEEKIKNIKGKIGFLEYAPAIQYLMGIGDEKVARVRVSKFMLFDKAGLLDFTRKEEIGAFILFAESLTYTEKNLENMEALWGMPERVGPLLLFSTNLK